MNRIAELRKRKKLRQSELAEMLQVAAATLSGYEIEKYQAPLETYIKLADYFGVTLDYLLGRVDEDKTVQCPAPYPEVTTKYSHMDDVDRVKVLAYMDGLLAAEKYSVRGKMINVG